MSTMTTHGHFALSMSSLHARAPRRSQWSCRSLPAPAGRAAAAFQEYRPRTLNGRGLCQERT